MRLRHLAPLTLVLALALPAAHAKVPFWGDAASMPADTPPAALLDGQWLWMPEAAPSGPIVVVVSLDEQRTYAYRNGVLIGAASSSTGKPGHGTPTGIFITLQKDANHRSSTYNNAPMPYQQRLTMDGVALHAGGLPGYPSSHGCVHLPSGFAKLLFEASPLGMTVVVADEHSAPRAVAHPLPVATVDPVTGAAHAEPRLAPGEAYRWEPQNATQGTLSLVLSRADQRVLVLRNGVEIGRAQVALMDDQPFGTHVYVAHRGEGGRLRWQAVSVPGSTDAGVELDSADIGRVRFPHGFLQAVMPEITEGTALVVTEEPIIPDTTGLPMTLLAEQVASTP